MENKIQNFYDLEAWKIGHNLVLDIYKMTSSFPQEEKFGLVSQLRRASSSITANIAEGFGRYHFNDKKKFYYQARGSALEVHNFLILSKDLNFVSSEACNMLSEKVVKTKVLVNGLIKSIENQK